MTKYVVWYYDAYGYNRVHSVCSSLAAAQECIMVALFGVPLSEINWESKGTSCSVPSEHVGPEYGFGVIRYSIEAHEVAFASARVS